MPRIVTVIGTRPEIIKMAPVVRALDRLSHEHILVHSGQHHDLLMDRIFFEELSLREPDYHFALRERSPHLQVATTMRQIASVARQADLVIVHGDTNTTLAGALLARKLGRRLAHVEAGLRSFDKQMPEETNRTIADHLSDLLFAPTKSSRENLRRENLTHGVHVVGNSVIDSLVRNLPVAQKRATILEDLGIGAREYILLTFHRAENVDRQERLRDVLAAIEAVSAETALIVVFPVHPRTKARLRDFGLSSRAATLSRLTMTEPVGYFNMLELESKAALVMTDSGGLQEEACFLRVPCVTLRDSTERPETLETGANVLAGTHPRTVVRAVRKQLAARRHWSNPFGDGRTGEKISRMVGRFLE